MNRLRPQNAAGPSPSIDFMGRKKVNLAPGRSLMDWIRLGRTQGDLSGVGANKLQVTPAELALHNTQNDIWMAVRGNVYNITPYMEYHPGGTDELMRAAGKDGTELFDEIHNWVNVESMLSKCLVGTLSLDAKSAASMSKYKRSPPDLRPKQEGVVSGTLSVPPPSFKAPSAPTSLKEPQRETETDIKVPQFQNEEQSVSIASIKPSVPCPTDDWYQRGKEIVIVVYTKWDGLRSEFVIVDMTKANELCIEVLVRECSYYVHFKPKAPVLNDCKVSVTAKGKVEVTFTKTDPNINWTTIGEPLSLHGTYPRTKNLTSHYRQWTVTSNISISHDTVLLRLHGPQGLRMVTPVGYHIHVKKNISGMDIARSYTVVTPSIESPFNDSDVLQGKALYLMIKYYAGGALTPWICNLKAGDHVQLSNFDGNFDLSRLDNITHLVMFAAGTGFTSMIQLIVHSIFIMKSATFPVKLVFYNKTEKDILWQDQLTALARSHSRFSVTHVLSKEPEWKGLKGRVNMDHIKKFVPEPSSECHPLLCICGPWAYNDAVESLAKLHDLGDDNLHIFSQT